MRRLLWLAPLVLAACTQGVDATESSANALTEYPSHGDTPSYSPSVPRGIDFLTGPVMTGTQNIFRIYYGKKPSWGTTLETFFSELNGSTLAHVLSTFVDVNGNTPSGKFIFPTAKVFTEAEIAAANLSTDLSEDDVRTIIQTKFPSPDLNALYMIVIGEDDTVAHGPRGLTICQDACDFHESVQLADDPTVRLRYAFIGDYKACINNPGPGGPQCQQTGLSPNCIVENGVCDPIGDEAVTKAFHELAEAITDPQPMIQGFDTDPWYPAYFPEAADLCEKAVTDPTQFPGVGYAQQDPNFAATRNGSDANIHLGAPSPGGHDYLVQPLWQNILGGGCVRRIVVNKPAVANVGVATGDFNGGGVGDLLMRDVSSGAMTFSKLNSYGVTETSNIPITTLAAGAEVYGIADFDKDGHADILWGNPNTNHLVVTVKVGTSDQKTIELVAANTLPAGINANNLPGTGVAAVGDFDGDHYADILFLDHSRNTTLVWLNKGSFGPSMTPITWSNLLPVLGTSITTLPDTIGTGIFDSSGHSAILWRNWDGAPDSATYSYYYWTMNGAVATVHSIPVAIPSNFPVLGIANVDNDALSDIVIKDVSNVAWVNISTGARKVIAPMPDPVWRYAGGTTLGSAGNALIWRHRQSGAVMLWTLSNAGTLSRTTYPVSSDGTNNELVAY